MKVAEYIADFLVSKGVTDNFMVTGGGAMHLNDALGHHDKIKTIYNHNEQGCSIAAESYARLTGRIASVCVTSGPGGTNAITGVMGGWLDSIPMFILSGQVKRETTLWSVPDLKLRQLGDQEYNIIDSVSCMTKYAVMLTNVEEVAYHIEKAWYLANNGRKGPVWIDVPLDIQGAPVDGVVMRHFNLEDELKSGAIDKVPRVNTEDVKEALQILAKAKSPLIFAGSGIRLSDSDELLLKVAAKINVPVAVAWNSGDLIAYNNPLYAGSPSREGTRGSSFIVQNCDALLVLGSRMNIRTITYNKHDFAKNAYKIMVDIDEAELNKPTFIPNKKICGDVREFLEKMDALAGDDIIDSDRQKWIDWVRMMVEKYPACLPKYHNNDKLLNPYVFVDELFDAMDERDVLTLGNGSACVMSFAGAKIKQGQRMYTNSGCAAMGYGMPAALGAAVARRDDETERVICVDGDGSLMMNIQELETISYNNLPVKLFVLNNNGYHSIRQTQRNLFGNALIGLDPDNGVGFPDFEKLAEAFGFKYFEIDSENTVRDTINKVFQAEGAVLCDVKVDSEQNFVPKLSSKVMPDGSIVSPSMDDMFPFLSREEYAANRFKV